MKILILDDELYFRQALKESFPWDALGITVCGEAKNGREGLEQVNFHHPDIVLADINMPLMDGLEFIEKVKEIDPDIKIIVISGYSEFEYAKQALRLGVQNYILKPISNDELYAALEDVIHQKNSEMKTTDEIIELKQSAKDNQSLLKWQFLNELVMGNHKFCERSKFSDLGLQFNSDGYIVCALAIDSEEYLSWGLNEKKLWNFGVINIVEELLSKGYRFEICSLVNECIIVIVNIKKSDQLFQQMLHEELQNILVSIANYLNFTITIGVGTHYEKIEDIAKSYNEALYALKNRVVLGGDSIIYYQKLAKPEYFGPIFGLEHRTQLIANMRLGNLENVKQIIHDIFAIIKANNVDLDILYVVSVEMLTPCLELISEKQIKYDMLYNTYFKNVIETIKQKKTIDQIKEYILEIYENIIDLVNQNKRSKPSETVETILKFITSHYSDCDLNVDDISKAVYVNYNYMCYLFKKDMGITLTEYITKYRMNKAIERMEKGEKYVMQVAEAVGFANVNYFGKCFKKEFGITPSKYIEGNAR